MPDTMVGAEGPTMTELPTLPLRDPQSDNYSTTHRARTISAVYKAITHIPCRPGLDINLEQVFKTTDVKKDLLMFYWHLEGQTG